MASSAPPDADDPPRVKLLCSFGGTILPRPLDGRLRYVGGETRIISLPRDVGFDDLMSRMRELYDGAAVLKYQQPDEDLDALVSVVNDDDVTNMMEEHDKLGSTPDGFIRLRVFLFPHPDLALHFDDDRDADRRYVDALNCVPDGNPHSPDLLLPLSRIAIPRRPSHGQLYAEVDGSWSPAAYYSPGQLTPREQYREFSPSPGRFQEYDHASPFMETGSVVWVPPGGVVPEMAGFPGNLGHSHGNIYEGTAGCEQCRVATLPRGQDAWYYDAPRPRHYGQFHLEQPGVAPEVCSECVRQREAPPPYMMNQDPTMFEREPFDRHTFYNDFHLRDRNWGGHPHQYNHHPEDIRANRNEQQQYLADANPMNFTPPHGGPYNGNSVSSNYVGYPDSRYVYMGNELGNEMYPDPYGALPPLRIPNKGEGGARYSNLPPTYGQVTDGSAHGSRRNVYFHGGTGPTYDPQPGLATQGNGGTIMGVPREMPGDGPWIPSIKTTDNFNKSSSGQNHSMTQKNFPVEAVPQYPPKWNGNTPSQENLCSASQESMHVHAGGSLGAAERNGMAASLSPRLASDSLANNNLPKVVSGGSDRGMGLRDLPGEANDKEQLKDNAAKLDVNKNPCLTKGIGVAFVSGQGTGNTDKHHREDDGNTSKSDGFVDVNSSLPEENKEYAIERLGLLPEIVASVKLMALEAEVHSAAVASPQKHAKETSLHDSSEQIDGYKDEKVDSNGEQALDCKIEPTKAEKEALAKGLQAIQNDDLEIIRELGSGAYGAVFHGKWKGTDVAIKKIKASCFSGKPSERERLISDFWKEALILSSLHHPNVVAFYGVVRDDPDGTLATVNEFMVNGSLKQFLQKKDRTVDRRKRLIIAMDAAFGMEYLHGKNIVHFDLKCENLLVNMRDPHRPICKIGDLGLSKVKQKTLVSGGVRGTLPWMAPELLSGKSKMVTEKVDVYSFGVVMWELLTGEDPYSDMHCASIIGGIVNSTLRPQIPSWCDPGWRSLMESCWSSDPNERPSFLEISQRLRKLAAEINLK